MIVDLMEHEILIEPTSSEEITTPGPRTYDSAQENQLSVQEWKQRLKEGGVLSTSCKAVEYDSTDPLTNRLRRRAEAVISDCHGGR